MTQYNVEGDSDISELHAKPRGNSKGCSSRNKSFYPSQKSLLTDLKQQVNELKLSQILKNNRENVGGNTNASTPREVIREQRQIYDAKRSAKKDTDPVDELLIFARASEEEIVLCHVDYPADAWVLGNSQMCNNLTKVTS